MNSWSYNYSSGGGGGSSSDGRGRGGGRTDQQTAPKKEISLQGPRPPSLEVSKDSHKIKKPPRPPLPHYHSHQQQGQQLQRNTAADDTDRQPVIIYDVSPKVIHTTADEFRNLVQRLTGIASESAADEGSSSVWGSSSSDAPISPAERLAALDRVSPTGRARERGERNSGTEIGGGGGCGGGWEEPMDIMAGLDLTEMIDLGQMIPGILSPAPANLPPTPAADSWAPIGYQDNTQLSPFVDRGNALLPSPSWNNQSLLPSPSWNQSLFLSPSSNFSFLNSPGSNYFLPSAPMTSPVMSPVLDFSHIFDS